MRFKSFFTFQSEFIFDVTDDGSTSVGLDDVVNLFNLLSNADPQSSSLGFVGFSSKNVVGCHIGVINRLHRHESAIASLTDSTQSQFESCEFVRVAKLPEQLMPETDLNVYILVYYMKIRYIS